jgi:CRISPR system Cascade subunit CasC
MIVELHVIQNFAPANLNRSDTGSPKDCQFGGHRRARVSSQCSKRAMRDYFDSKLDKSASVLALRSKRLHARLAELIAKQNPDIPDLDFCVEAILATCGIFLVEEEKQVELEDGSEQSRWVSESETLAFLGEDTVVEVARLIAGKSTQAAQAGEIFKNYRAEKRKGDKYKGGVAKDDKKKLVGKVKTALGKEMAEEIEHALDGSAAADLALFGRMLADLPKKNIEAACQVAHAISTHKVGNEFDFYTAVDDLLPKGETGAGMMGTLEFNSACLYRYANVNLTQLHTNLNDAALEEATLQAFLRAFVEAVPTGKQNGYAAHQKPSFVLAVVRRADKCSLANAFAAPVRPEQKDGREIGLIENSILRLDQEWGEQTSVYGDGSLGKWFACGSVAALPNLGQRVTTEKGQAQLDALIANVMNTVKGGN